MHRVSLFHAIKPYLAVCTALVLVITLLMDTFFFNELAFPSSAILWFFLVSALIIIAIQVIRTEKDIRNYSSQLLISKERLTNEIKHRIWAEKTASESKTKSMFIDENIPVMLAYFNVDLCCRYHNRIFRQWFGLNSSQIDGRLLTEFSGEEFFSDIKNYIEEILSGKTIHNERILRSTKGFPYIFTEQYVPHLDNKGRTIGFYTMHTPRMQEKNRVSLKSRVENSIKPEPYKTDEVPVKSNTSLQSQISKSETTTTTATRIGQAIEGGEFNLYYQQINPIKSTTPSHYEILIRMNEEENNLMPPDSFLPFVDQFKMMPQLDRWIGGHIIRWLSVQPKTHAIFCLNVAKDTLSDHAFPGFIQNLLRKMNVAAPKLCFEIEVFDAEINTPDVIIFSQEINKLGCLLSLCSFNHNPSSIELLDKIKVDYLKIDGSLICNILRDEEDLERVIAINQLAHKAGIKTIAELVETDDILAKLQEVGVDYVQGFGIAKTRPFKDLKLPLLS